MRRPNVRAARAAVVLLIGALAAANASAEVRQDLQQWTLFRVSKPIPKRWTFSFQAEGRFGDDISRVCSGSLADGSPCSAGAPIRSRNVTNGNA